LPRLTPQVRVLLRRMAPGLLGAGVTQLNLAVDVIIASLLPAGTVSVLYYADRVQQLPLGVIGTAVGTALLPLLSRQVRAGEAAAALGTLNRALEYALFLTLPAAFAFVVSADPVIAVLFGRGAFGGADVTRAGEALAAYAIGLPAFVAVKVMAPGFFARGDTATPVKIGLTAVALNLALNLAFMIPLRHIGPPLATSVAAMFNLAGLAWVLHRRGQFAPDARLRQHTIRMLGAALLMAVALAVTQYGLFHVLAPRGVLRAAALGALIAVGMLTYFGAGHALGAFDARDALGLLARRGLRRPARSAINPTTEH
jgi:putative peptidoglycan lipid II flippase